MLRKVFFTGALLIWLMIIFLFSAKPADESTEMSTSVGRAICSVFISDYSSWPIDKQEDMAAKIDFPVRKCAHASEYALLGFLLLFTADSYIFAKALKGRIALIGGVLYAVSDELHQLFVPGRSCQVTDMMIDTVGVCAGILCGYLVIKIIGIVSGRKALSSHQNV